MIGRCFGTAAPLCAALLLASPLLAQDDMDDILGGFDDEEPGFEVDRAAIDEVEERWWDLSGSLEVSASVNVRSHTSATGTDYGGLQRWRNRVNLQFDAELPAEWQLRLEGWTFYDLAYLLNDRDDYTRQVKKEYEFDWDLREVYVQGKLHERVDLKLGRQIVIWGRSESLRVLDVLNPLDNREPGRVDLEDLRRTLGMARIDGYAGDWTFTAIAIPELRFDLNPVLGSDFLPVGKPPGLPTERKPESFESWELAGAVTGTFSGWDLSLHGAWFFDDQARLDGFVAPLGPIPIGVRQVHDRLWMVGTGGNYTVGAWLLKGELAYKDGFGFDTLAFTGPPQPPGFSAPSGSRGRIDALLGVEYYGILDTSITLEGVYRHLLQHTDRVRDSFAALPEGQYELAFRATRSLLRERLDVTALGILVGQDSDDPSMIFRLGADYELRDALVLGGGILIFVEGDTTPLDGWGKNDRLFLNLKWSF